MSLIQTPTDIEYPESDGEPMGETDLHRNWMMRLYELLRFRYGDQSVYIASDLLLYYVEGDPRSFVVPDVFIVKDSDPGMRRTFRIWDEGRVPNVVFEVTSRATRANDEVTKPKTYARIGIRELFLYDPTGDYLKTRLQGYRLDDGDYARIEPNASGRLDCEELDLHISLDGVDLVLHDRATGLILPTAAEAHHAEAEAERAAAETHRAEAEAERAAAKAERVAREAADAEIIRLREELERLRGTD